MFFYTQSSKKRCVFFDQRFRTVHGMVSSYLYKLPAALRTETVSFMHETLRLNNPGHLHSCLPLQKNVIYLYSMGADSCSSIIKVPRNVVSFLINAFVQSMEWFRALYIKLPAALRTETVSFMHETLRLNNPGHLHSCLPLQTNVIYLYSMGADFMFFYNQSSKKRLCLFDQRFRTVHGMVSSSLYKLPAMLRTETVSFMHETLRLQSWHSCLPLQTIVIYLYSMGADSCSSIFKVPRNVVFFDQRFRTVHGMVSGSLYKLPAMLRTETVSFMHETLRLPICIHVFHYRQM